MAQIVPRRSMGIPWKEDETHFRNMEILFLQLGKQGITMNHYDLYDSVKRDHPVYTPDRWKEFLTDQRVSAYVQEEFEAIKSAELRKIITDINSSKSVGQAQIINALTKMLDDNDPRNNGPAYIYCYIPLNEEQAQADNVTLLPSDPFIVEGRQ